MKLKKTADFEQPDWRFALQAAYLWRIEFLNRYNIF